MPSGMNDTCTWPPSAANVAGRTLLADVRIAEELAMRYADANFDSKAAHGRFRTDCEARLFALVARIHGVQRLAVDRAREDLATRVWDPPVHVPLVTFVLAATAILARRVPRRFQPDERAAAVAATLFLSLLLAIVVQVFGHLWDGAVEMIRIGNTHMSYRVERLGWRQYSGAVFIGTVLLFWFAVLASYRRRRAPDRVG